MFRNICIDSRTPIQRKSGGWFFAEECNYNPYIAKWKGEDGYKPLIEIGVTSNKNGFSISKQKLSHERSLL